MLFCFKLFLAMADSPSQKFPSYCTLHSHVAASFISLQVPPFLHGFGEQGFDSEKKKVTKWSRNISSKIYDQRQTFSSLSRH